MRGLSLLTLFLLVIPALSPGCKRGHSGTTDDSDSIKPLPDTLRVGTLYSPTSYFIYREEKMGYDYDLISRFGKDKGIVIDLEV
ncbi:MAG: lytic transglycosylase F, partial [Muribaculum sp.]|nr:lytic transglycosylase F [Muribaculum sp.]